MTSEPVILESEMKTGYFDTVTPGLLTAINAVMKAVSHAPKTLAVSTGSGASYKAASEVDVLAALRPAMIENGLMLFPVDIPVREVSELHSKTRDGYERTTHRVDLQVVYRLYHTSGGYIDMPHCGRGDDSGDKSYGKAETYAFKYALRQCFALPTGDDPDRDASPEPDEAPRKMDVKRVPIRQPTEYDTDVPPPQPAPEKGELKAYRVMESEVKFKKDGGQYLRLKLQPFDLNEPPVWATYWNWGQAQAITGMEDPARYRGAIRAALSYDGKWYTVDFAAGMADDTHIAEEDPELIPLLPDGLTPGD